jgi:hypothetical protein
MVQNYAVWQSLKGWIVPLAIICVKGVVWFSLRRF